MLYQFTKALCFQVTLDFQYKPQWLQTRVMLLHCPTSIQELCWQKIPHLKLPQPNTHTERETGAARLCKYLCEMEKFNNAGSNHIYKHITSSIVQLWSKTHYSNVIKPPQNTDSEEARSPAPTSSLKAMFFNALDKVNTSGKCNYTENKQGVTGRKCHHQPDVELTGKGLLHMLKSNRNPLPPPNFQHPHSNKAFRHHRLTLTQQLLYTLLLPFSTPITGQNQKEIPL